MDRLNFAAIDIGSNAVRLLIKGFYPGESVSDLSKVFIVRVPLRLGQDTFTKGRISTEKTEKLLRLMHAFSQLMQVYNVLSYRACATSAMRDSSNGADIVRYISERSEISKLLMVLKKHVSYMTVISWTSWNKRAILSMSMLVAEVPR